MKYLSDRIFTNILPIYNNRYFSKSDTKCNHKRHLEIAVSYPNASDEINEQNRSLVHKILATCLGVPNLWVLKTKREDLNSIESAEESAQYPDYDYQGNLSFIKGTPDKAAMTIGKKPIQKHCKHCQYTDNFDLHSFLLFILF